MAATNDRILEVLTELRSEIATQRERIDRHQEQCPPPTAGDTWIRWGIRALIMAMSTALVLLWSRMSVVETRVDGLPPQYLEDGVAGVKADVAAIRSDFGSRLRNIEQSVATLLALREKK